MVESKPVAVFVLVSEYSQVLMEWREDFCPPGSWVFPGGKPEPGDDGLSNTCIREAREELGIEVTQITPLSFVQSVNGWVNMVFLVTEWKNADGHLFGGFPTHTDGGDRVEWQRLDFAKEVAWGPAREIARLVEAYLGNSVRHYQEVIMEPTETQQRADELANLYRNVNDAELALDVAMHRVHCVKVENAEEYHAGGASWDAALDYATLSKPYAAALEEVQALDFDLRTAHANLQVWLFKAGHEREQRLHDEVTESTKLIGECRRMMTEMSTLVTQAVDARAQEITIIKEHLGLRTVGG